MAQLVKNIRTGDLGVILDDEYEYEADHLCSVKVIGTGEVLHWELRYDWRQEHYQEISLYQTENHLIEFHLINN